MVSRNSQSCENCRNQKLACRRADSQAACERCLRLSKDCKLHVAKPRSERAPRINQRRRNNSTSIERDVNPPIDRVFQPEQKQNNGIEIVTGAGVESRPEILSFGESLLNGLEIETTCQETAAILSLTSEQATNFLSKYRRKSERWPFIIVDSFTTAFSLCTRTPFLLVALLTVASSTDPALRQACTSAFRKVLAMRVIIKGGKSLEILQALLVFLAWHHHYLKHETQQIYLYLQLAIGMTVDLGMCDEKYIGERRVHAGEGPRIAIRGLSRQPITSDGKRALLGCYHLSVGLSVIGFNRPQTMEYTSYMVQCAADLAKEEMYEEDVWFPGTIELLHLVEQCRFSHSGSSHISASENRELRMVIGYLRKSILDLKHSIEARNRQPPTWLSATQAYASVYLLERAHSLSAGHSSSVAQIIDALACLEATTSYLEHVLEKCLLAVQDVGMVEWIQLGSGLAIMTMMTIQVQLSGGHNDVDLTYSTLSYIETLQSAVLTAQQHEKISFATWFCDMTEKWKKRLTRFGSNGGMPAPDLVLETVKEPAQDSTMEITHDESDAVQASSTNVTPQILAAPFDTLQDMEFDDEFWPGFIWGLGSGDGQIQMQSF